MPRSREPSTRGSAASGPYENPAMERGRCSPPLANGPDRRIAPARPRGGGRAFPLVRGRGAGAAGRCRLPDRPPSSCCSGWRVRGSGSREELPIHDNDADGRRGSPVRHGGDASPATRVSLDDRSIGMQHCCDLSLRPRAAVPGRHPRCCALARSRQSNGPTSPDRHASGGRSAPQTEKPLRPGWSFLRAHRTGPGRSIVPTRPRVGKPTSTSDRRAERTASAAGRRRPHPWTASTMVAGFGVVRLRESVDRGCPRRAALIGDRSGRFIPPITR